MAGTQTNGFDMVIEVSGQTIQNLLSATFDNDGLLGSILPDTIGVLDGFGLDLSLSRPAGIPGTAANPIQLLFTLNFTNGSSGTLDVVVGMDVDRSDPDLDKVILDFPNKLYRCDLSIPGVPTAIAGVAATFIRGKLDNNPIPFMPIPVNRSSTATTSIIRADVKVIDDTTSANNDALGITLTYGGGTAGNLNNFTQAFSREGAGAAVAINFAWICRNISPRIESGIGLPAGSFAGCSFSGDFEIREGVKLKSMSITPADDHIVLRGRVAKSGTCYEASGSFTARIFVSITGGELRVSFETDNPDIDIDIPWYCWLGAAVIGALLGGIIAGVIGTVVGAIIIPLLLWIAQSVIESTIENVAGQVTDAINGIDDLNVQLVGIDTILDRAFIDDLTVTYDMYPQEYWPIQSQGTIRVRSGQYADLDNGIVSDAIFGGADLRLEGSGQSRLLKVLCGSAAAPLYTSKSFDRIRRFDLLMRPYGTTGSFPLPYFATYIPIPFISDRYFETKKMVACKTSDNAFSFFEVSNVTETEFIIRYKTFKANIYTLDFGGSFRCKPFHMFDERIKLDKVSYIPARTLNAKMNDTLTHATTLKQAQAAAYAPVAALKASGIQARQVSKPLTDAAALQKQMLQMHKATGNWIGHYMTVRDKKTGTFVAKVNGNIAVSMYTWIVDGHSLGQHTNGTVKVKNQDFDYTTNGKTLTLASRSESVLEVPIKLMVTFENGLSDSIIKCVPYRNNCPTTRRFVPGLRDYMEKFDEEYGVVML